MVKKFESLAVTESPSYGTTVKGGSVLARPQLRGGKDDLTAAGSAHRVCSSYFKLPKPHGSGDTDRLNTHHHDDYAPEGLRTVTF